MTQKDRELLFKDLCARLLYKVKGIITYDENNTTFTVEGIDNNVLHLSDAEECHIEDFKPYLRSMSSMTEEERKEYERFSHCGIGFAPTLMDWIYSHHLDCYGLIPKGLALEAPEGMYK